MLIGINKFSPGIVLWQSYDIYDAKPALHKRAVWEQYDELNCAGHSHDGWCLPMLGGFVSS